ncbi:MAG TPA: EAL domain-containing protein [Bryobacteraceae bacterium]|jgi:diguanylate cyclase (GGDEF)-like protein|nr:EAL domain-containing protein [Bryobacteraceae bacterium]
MKRLIKPGLVTALALAGVFGSILGTRALKQAITRSQDLYRIDTVGSQIESRLEYETQESRRAFLYALAVTDPNEQLPYIDQARAASTHVREAVEQLWLLRASEIEAPVNEFENSWEAYSRVRDEIVAHVLEGDAAAALAVESGRGQPAFAVSLGNLHALKTSLERHASNASQQVDSILKRSAASLAGFAICTLLIVAFLAKANRERRQALKSLAAETEMEEQRASILEMVSTHAPLSRILETIVDLVPKHAAGAGAAIWVATGADLHFQVAANLPQELLDQMQRYPFPQPAGDSVRLAELELNRNVLASQFGLVAAESKPLQDAGGRLIGMLQVFSHGRDRGVQAALADQMAQLASVGIENTLLYERLAFQAQHDTLTGLPNRLLFQDRVQQALQLARRHHKKAAVVWIDLDRYKQINDTLGHRIGDELLSEVARRLKCTLRESDTAARVGGDEFTVLAHDINSSADAETVAAKITEALSKPMVLAGHAVTVAASMGVSLFPDHGEDPIVLLRNADLAMYSAKREGGNRHHLFRPALGDTMQRRLQIEEQLRTALEHQEFSLEFQPLLNRNGHLDAMEALLRWTNPVLGRVSPAEFIPVAEEIGLILAIGEWVTESACRHGAEWLRAGYEIPRIAVNVSAVQIIEKGFAPMVERVLKLYGFPAAKLELEITETALMNNLDRALEQIELLRQLGVRFAIDDFGTGYSSLSQLRTLPVDCVKIDRSFIKDLAPQGSGSTTLVRGIIGLAHNLELQVVAEGVETQEQLTLLQSMGCDINQGFFLYRPMPREAVELLLQSAATAEVQGNAQDAQVLLRV